MSLTARHLPQRHLPCEIVLLKRRAVIANVTEIAGALVANRTINLNGLLPIAVAAQLDLSPRLPAAEWAEYTG